MLARQLGRIKTKAYINKRYALILSIVPVYHVYFNICLRVTELSIAWANQRILISAHDVFG